MLGEERWGEEVYIIKTFCSKKIMITQLYAGECPSNNVDCLTLQIQLTKAYNWLFLANPTDKYARQWSSLARPRSSTGSHICQLDVIGMVWRIILSSSLGFAKFVPIFGIAHYTCAIKNVCDVLSIVCTACNLRYVQRAIYWVYSL